MKCKESWLREWVNPSLTQDKLCTRLTMTGFEVEGCEDDVIDISITPNRGDCLSIRGMAREIAAITSTQLTKPAIVAVTPVNNDVLPVRVTAKTACPRYCARVIRQVNMNISTPVWLKERLLSCGAKSINPIVDVMNYVMFELGQPMHAFDLNSINKLIQVRLSHQDELITLLDGSVKTLDDETLVIADAKKPLAIAGVMGGLDSSVTLTTKDVLLESAFFSPEIIARQRQAYGLNSDSSYRFERGVDPTIQTQAIERATELILEIAGGHPGPIIEMVSQSSLPKLRTINLPFIKISRVLGIDISHETVEHIFKCLHLNFKRGKTKWTVQVPAYRFDLSLPEDLIEEIARLHGYDNIPTTMTTAGIQVARMPSSAPDLYAIKQAISNQSYHEIISYSFVEPKLQQLLNPAAPTQELLNPITAEMTVMRTSLWPGLIAALQYNLSRQQNRVRLFESGDCFILHGKKIEQTAKIAGLITGTCLPEQWGTTSRSVDFFDLKGNLENLGPFKFKPDNHPALHPGQTAGIYDGDQKIGVMGALHPSVLQTLGLPGPVFVFELDIKSLLTPKSKPLEEISKFPEIRRDIAILVKQTIPVKDIQDTIKSVAGDWLKDVFIFDVYQGKGISPGHKSIALALIWQHPTRTLVDDDVTDLMHQVVTTLKGHLGAELRS